MSYWNGHIGLMWLQFISIWQSSSSKAACKVKIIWTSTWATEMDTCFYVIVNNCLLSDWFAVLSGIPQGIVDVAEVSLFLVVILHSSPGLWLWGLHSTRTEDRLLEHGSSSSRIDVIAVYKQFYNLSPPRAALSPSSPSRPLGGDARSLCRLRSVLFRTLTSEHRY